MQAGRHETIKAPGIVALLRRHPVNVQRTAAGAIASGLVLFVIASVTTAGAAPSKHPAVAGAPTHATATPFIPFTDLGTQAPAAQPAAVVAPKTTTAPAPTDPSAISALADNGIPAVALNAYRVAAARLAHTEPGCGIDWALLAGIGREESDHGQFDGAVLHADGVSTPRIIGIPLNGNGTALIPDTDHGVLDGDTVYDHAVGPMQFIPSTWAEYGTDADGDGVANVFDINDAALTAARYLCAAGGNLHSHAGQVAAVLAYNDSSQYLAQVLALADAYRRGVPISGIPVGNTTGALPSINQPGAVPPANPGAPTANQAAKASAAKAAAQKSAAQKSAAAQAAAQAAAKPSSAVPTTGAGAAKSVAGGGSAAATTTAAAKASASPTPSPSSTSCALVNLLAPTQCFLPG